jgi:hypothetical protein
MTIPRHRLRIALVTETQDGGRRGRVPGRRRSARETAGRLPHVEPRVSTIGSKAGYLIGICCYHPASRFPPPARYDLWWLNNDPAPFSDGHKNGLEVNNFYGSTYSDFANAAISLTAPALFSGMYARSARLVPCGTPKFTIPLTDTPASANRRA